jgi:F1F0 ATPase subunit 2
MIVVALIGGLILGILFFGGLWLTVKRTLGSPYIALWLLGSSLLRTAIVLTGFYFMAQGSLCVSPGFLQAALWFCGSPGNLNKSRPS